MSDANQTDSRRSGRMDIRTFVAVCAFVLPGFGLGLIAWGRTEAKVDNHEKQLEQIIPLTRAVADLTTAVAVLSTEVRNLRDVRLRREP